jgi:hypothetical protein
VVGSLVAGWLLAIRWWGFRGGGGSYYGGTPPIVLGVIAPSDGLAAPLLALKDERTGSSAIAVTKAKKNQRIHDLASVHQAPFGLPNSQVALLVALPGLAGIGGRSEYGTRQSWRTLWHTAVPLM